MSEEMAQTIGIMHGVRNEVYHVGLQHEAILPSLSLFYFNVACTYICSYKPPFLTWSSNQKLPARAKKYFRRDDEEFGEADDFRQGCDKLALDVGHKPADTIAALADHFDEAIQQQDACIDTIAEGVYPSQRTTRDDAFMDCQIRSARLFGSWQGVREKKWLHWKYYWQANRMDRGALSSEIS
jgi:hypothetical protein